MLDLFHQLFGYYEPIVQLVSGDPLNGDAVYQCCIDWSYVFNLILVCIVVHRFRSKPNRNNTEKLCSILNHLIHHLQAPPNTIEMSLRIP